MSPDKKLRLFGIVKLCIDLLMAYEPTVLDARKKTILRVI